jgi:HTH-type transcriptional repressor of NAD biosynthesis genes
MRRGLVVGKFMPLHRGHQLLIETALANVDELTIVVYNSHVDDDTEKLMPASKRAGWIAQLYPQVHNLVVLNDPPIHNQKFQIPLDRDNPKYATVYGDQVEFLGPFTHVFSSEDYGQPFADAITRSDVNSLSGPKPIECKHVTVDAARELMPISGTTFRSDMFKYRAYVDPLVYRSLIQKVVFVGTESTGKSTISKALAEKLGTMYTQEYGRSLWEEIQRRKETPTFHDLWRVAHTQYEQEQAAALHSDRYLFCDTNAWTTMLWSEMYYRTADQRLYDLVEKTKHEYLWFYCHNDFGWVDDGQRELSGDKAEQFAKVNIRALASTGVSYQVLRGTLEQRIETVCNRLEIPVMA